MKKLLFLQLFISMLLSAPAPAMAQVPPTIDKQTQIDILSQELKRLISLVAIMQSQPSHQINAKSYLVTNLKNDEVILDHNSSQVLPIASVTKLMTALVAIENIDLNKTIVLDQEILSQYGASPVLYTGRTVTAEDLLKATLIQSSNDSAYALARFLGSGASNFVALMNQKAKDLNMLNTTFYDPHGLNPSNKSTAQDLTKLLKYIHGNHSEIFTMGKDNNFWMQDQSGRWLKFMNVNNFYDFPNFIGGKTGYIPESKQTMASVFNINGNPTAVVVLSSDDRQADILSLINPAKKIFASM